MLSSLAISDRFNYPLTPPVFPYTVTVAQPHRVQHLLGGQEDPSPHRLDELVAFRDLLVVQRVEQVIQRIVLDDLLRLLLVPTPHSRHRAPLEVLVRVHAAAAQHRQRAHRRRHLHSRPERPSRESPPPHLPQSRGDRSAEQRSEDAAHPLHAVHSRHVVLQRVHHARVHQ